jgi:hypothetical protein
VGADAKAEAAALRSDDAAASAALHKAAVAAESLTAARNLHMQQLDVRLRALGEGRSTVAANRMVLGARAGAPAPASPLGAGFCMEVADSGEQMWTRRA